MKQAGYHLSNEQQIYFFAHPIPQHASQAISMMDFHPGQSAKGNPINHPDYRFL